MQKEILDYIKENSISPFKKSEEKIKNNEQIIFKTSDARKVYSKLIELISAEFNFKETSQIWKFFGACQDEKEIIRRQNYFKEIQSMKLDFGNELRKINKPMTQWNPPYGIMVVTEDESVFSELKNKGCPVKYLLNERDVESLEDYDLIQAIECENFRRILERLPQSIFLDSLEEAYLERYIESISGWKNNLEILDKISGFAEFDILKSKTRTLLELCIKKEELEITEEKARGAVDKINSEVERFLRNLTLNGEEIIQILSNKKLPEELKKKIKYEVSNSHLPEHLFNIEYPITLNLEELQSTIREGEIRGGVYIAELIRKKSKEVIETPKVIREMSEWIILLDFLNGVKNYMTENMHFPEISHEMKIECSKNLFLKNAKEISFKLDDNIFCSVLTGANSGGKTTLLEHVIQISALTQMGLPINGKIKIPIFSELYYFAKNKGVMNKGAFENLLTQLSIINPQERALILADEIESVTEPGVAGKIISATIDYFINKNCFMIVATHLGREVKNRLPKKSRIDGIEARGLDENFELIVDHNPILGKLAHSTPELIVEKLANTQDKEYFRYLNSFLKKEIKESSDNP